jgi:hypothetical protein
MRKVDDEKIDVLIVGSRGLGAVKRLAVVVFSISKITDNR